MKSLVGDPSPSDTILYCIPVCAPYIAMQDCKVKVKLLPGTAKRGKAAKTCFQAFLKDKLLSVNNRKCFFSSRFHTGSFLKSLLSSQCKIVFSVWFKLGPGKGRPQIGQGKSIKRINTKKGGRGINWNEIYTTILYAHFLRHYEEFWKREEKGNGDCVLFTQFPCDCRTRTWAATFPARSNWPFSSKSSRPEDDDDGARAVCSFFGGTLFPLQL